MKKIFSIAMLFGLSLLGACEAPNSQNQSEVELPAGEVIIEPTIQEAVKEDDEAQVESFEEIDESNLHLSNGPGREIYATESYLSLGESFAVGNTGRMYGEVSLDSYELIEDSNGSGRQALMLWFTETNTTNQAIEVGWYGAETIVFPVVFYEELRLEILSHTQPHSKFFDPEYIENMHVQYGNEEETKSQSCTTTVTLNPGDSRSCFTHYSYAGKGDYLISQAIDGAEDQTAGNLKNYLIEIK